MDAAVFFAFQATENDSDEVADEHVITTAAILTTGAEVAKLLRNERRQPSRNYLTRLDLPPNPHLGTAWRHLFESQNDRAFITTMGFDVATFKVIVGSGFGARWLSRSIPRNDSASAGNPRPGGRSLDTDGALGLVLHYLNSTMLESSLQQLFGLIPTTVSRYITFSLNILLETLRQMDDAAIRWPRTLHEFQGYNKLITARHPRLHGAFASIDGLNLITETSDNTDIENATFNGWLSAHFISSVIVFAPDGMISSS
jgi:hypothetical protein